MQSKPRYDYHNYFIKMEQQHPQLNCMHLNVSLLFPIMHIMYKKFCEIQFNRHRDATIVRILEKPLFQHPLASYVRTNNINVIS